jgi:hypothetical protein
MSCGLTVTYAPTPIRGSRRTRRPCPAHRVSSAGRQRRSRTRRSPAARACTAGSSTGAPGPVRAVDSHDQPAGRVLPPDHRAAVWSHTHPLVVDHCPASPGRDASPNAFRLCQQLGEGPVQPAPAGTSARRRRPSICRAVSPQTGAIIVGSPMSRTERQGWPDPSGRNSAAVIGNRTLSRMGGMPWRA